MTADPALCHIIERELSQSPRAAGYDLRNKNHPFMDTPCMRWILLTATLFALIICFTRHSGGAMGAWLMLGVLGIFATVLAFVQARISASSRDDGTLSEYDLQQLRAGKEPLKHQRDDV